MKRWDLRYLNSPLAVIRKVYLPCAKCLCVHRQSTSDLQLFNLKPATVSARSGLVPGFHSTVFIHDFYRVDTDQLFFHLAPAAQIPAHPQPHDATPCAAQSAGALQVRVAPCSSSLLGSSVKPDK
jgi:hypothetical protein